jgi:hypothetical protein
MQVFRPDEENMSSQSTLKAGRQTDSAKDSASDKTRRRTDRLRMDVAVKLAVTFI